MKHYFTTIIESTFKNVDSSYLEKYLTFVLEYKTDAEYKEKHHILPKSLFPQYKNDKWNIVKLASRDHFYAHYYLHKALPSEPRMAFALWGMCNQQSENHRDREYIDKHTEEISLIYEEARKVHAKLVQERQLLNNTMKGRTKENSPFYGQKRSKEVVDKMIANHWSKWRKPWNHNNVNKGAWISALKTYEYWNGTKCSSTALEKKFGYPTQFLLTVHKHFKKGWIPKEDKEFLDWLSLNT